MALILELFMVISIWCAIWIVKTIHKLFDKLNEILTIQNTIKNILKKTELQQILKEEFNNYSERSPPENESNK